MVDILAQSAGIARVELRAVFRPSLRLLKCRERTALEDEANSATSLTIV